MRRHGLTVDNLRAVDLVTADGERLRVDADSEPELFWGLRGGGGNFGIATAFEYDLHPVGPLVLGGPVFWPLEQAPEVLRVLREFAPDAPDELGIMIVAHRAPPLPFLPPERYGAPVLGLLLVWSGDLAEGERAIAPLRAVGAPLGRRWSGPVPYRAVQSLLDGGAPRGTTPTGGRTACPTLSDAVDRHDRRPRRVDHLAALAAQRLGDRRRREPRRPGATAVGEREVGFELRLIAVWPPGDPDGERHRPGCATAGRRCVPHSAGVYATFLSDEGRRRRRAAYGDRLARLTALKDRYDPANVFRLNANIPPSGEEPDESS